MKNPESLSARWNEMKPNSNFNEIYDKIVKKNRHQKLIRFIRTFVFILMIAFFYRIKKSYDLYSPYVNIGFLITYIDLVVYLILLWYNTRKLKIVDDSIVNMIEKNRITFQKLRLFYKRFVPCFAIFLIIGINLILYDIVYNQVFGIRIFVHLLSITLIGSIIWIGRNNHINNIDKNLKAID